MKKEGPVHALSEENYKYAKRINCLKGKTRFTKKTTECFAKNCSLKTQNK